MSLTTSPTRFLSRSFLTWGLLAALLLAVPSTYGQDVSVGVPDTTVVTGDTVSVPVSLSNLDQASGVTAYGFELSFDSDSLAYVGFETAGTLSDVAGFTVDDNQDVPRIGGFGDTPLNDVSAEGTAVLLKFAVLAEGTTEVTLPNLQFNDGSPAPNPVEPAFIVTGAPPNFPPVARGDSYETSTGTSLQIGSVSEGVLENDSDPNGDALAASVGESVSNGTITFESDGTFEYTPDSGFTGEDTFRYGASDPAGAVDSATVTISVKPPNTPPTITEIGDQTIQEDGTVGPLSFTIDDAETAPEDLSIQSASDNQSLIPDDSISVEGTGGNREIGITPTSNESGTSQVTVSVSDGRSSSSQEFQVSVQPVNDPPVGTDDQYRAPADDTLRIIDSDRGVLANDSDIERDPLSAYVLDGASNGSLSLDSTGTFEYVPDPGFTGSDEFTYVVADGRGASDTSTAAITVQSTDSVALSADSVGAAPGNTVAVPVRVNGLSQTASITAYSFSLGYDETAVEYRGVSVDSTLSEKAGFTVEDNPEQGQIGAFGDESLGSVASEGVLLYLQFAPLEEGVSAVTLEDVQFNTGVPPVRPSEPQFVVVGDPPNRPPQASSDQYRVTEGKVLAAEEAAEGVLANDADPDEDSLTASLLESPTNGSLTFQDSGTFEYVPDSAFTGTDSFRYRASDPQGLRDSTSVEVKVEKNDAVAVALDDVRGNQGDTLTVPIRLDRLGQVDDITSYGFDVSFDTTKVEYVGFSSSGTLSEQADFTVDGNPDVPRIGGFGAMPLNGVDDQGVMLRLEFQLLESGSTDITLQELQFNEGSPPPNPSAPSSTVTTNPLDRPTALTDSFSVQEDNALGVEAPGVLGNDFNPKGDPASLDVSLVSGVSDGTLSLARDGSFEYEPNPDYNGSDSFIYEATDADGASDTSMVHVTVQPVNDPPTVTSIQDTTINEDARLEEISFSVGDQETDADSLAVTASSSNADVVPDDGIKLSGSGSDRLLTAVPRADSSGVAPITVVVEDNGKRADTTFDLTVREINDAPVAYADTFQTAEDSVLTVEAPGVLGNDTDVDDDSLSASIVNGPSNGNLTLREDGSFRYDSGSGFSGKETFTYQALDGSGAVDTASVAVTILPTNDPPVARADSFQTPEDSTLTIEASGVLENDTDPNSDSLSASLLSSASNGRLVFNADGSFEYTPEANFNGEDRFTYRTLDDSSAADTASVTLAVRPVNDPPVAKSDSFGTTKDSVLTVEAPGVLGNDTDADEDALSAALVSEAGNGDLTLQEDGSFEYVPSPGFSGEDSFTYRALDDSSAADTASARIVVLPPPEPPEDLSASADGEAVSLSWTGPAAEDVAQYRIYRSTTPIDSSAGPSAISALDSTSVGETSYQDTSAAPGQTYYYRVTAVDTGAAESALSGEATTTSEDTAPPAAPESLTAQLEGRQVSLSWSAVASEDLSGYRLYRSTGQRPDTSGAGLTEGLVSGTSFTDTTATDNRTYRYGVTAVDTAGNESALSAAASVFRYPSRIQAEVSRSFGEASEPRDYRLVALPGETSRPIADVISGEAGAEWQAYRDDGSGEDFLQKFDGSDSFTFEPGNGFWVTATSDLAFEDSVSTVPLEGDSAATVSLREGWNVISNPTGKSVGWDRIREANAGSLQPLFGFQGTFSQADSLKSAASGRAYYLFNGSADRTELVIPYPGSPSSPGSQEKSQAPPRAAAERGSETGLVSLSAAPAGSDDGPASTVRVGTGAGAPRSVVAPPGQFESVSLRIKAGETKTGKERRPSSRSRLLMTERRDADGDGETFRLRLKSQIDAPVQIRARGLGETGVESVALLHPSAGKTYSLRPGKSVEIGGDQEEVALRLAVGTDGYVDGKREAVLPEKVRLTSYPNPIRRQGTLEYALPEAQGVSLQVYDVLGRKVKTLTRGQKEAGRHRVDLRTGQLSSGIYFGRLKAGGQTRTQKITVVR